ncbi:hypothetical protein NLJ89_g2363 [Agrocybe chaxingu]|uniref:RlpA-like protein double-psi beta-barrel domain-containing protein n=1 Tax=Agrocybe chaxingu TaxID=84603 RepID=A0A9W8MXP9_9AGAR|nr:hypothetical protein NLJ89_g2363 [Agrocybe chaxingu]
MQHIALFFNVFACVMLTLAFPLPSSSTIHEDELVDIEKRIDHVGRGTWFRPGLGNCGKWNNASDLIVAIGKRLYDRNKGSNCDQYMEIINTANGKKAYGLTRDSCHSCSDDDIDMSPALFKKLAPLEQGVIRVSWHFKNRSWRP